jgi:hypothetical protein
MPLAQISTSKLLSRIQVGLLMLSDAKILTKPISSQKTSTIKASKTHLLDHLPCNRVESILRRFKNPLSKICIHLSHITENWSAELHPAFNNTRPILAHNPVGSLDRKGFSSDRRRVSQGNLVEPESDFGVC